MGTAATRAKRKYEASNYERIVVIVKDGEKEKITERAKGKGLSVSGYISELIYSDLGEPCPIEIKKEEN